MARSAYERLSTLDASFLALETRSTHMHVAGISIFDAGPLSTGGGVDIDRLRRFIASRLEFVPRYRQRLAYVPLERHPVWVDDEHFNLDYHVRHSSLPNPGTEEQLKRMAGLIISQQLDRTKPLWEMWVVEGLEGGRFAVISKIHHSMIDGVAGAGIMAAILGFAPTDTVPEPAEWTPLPVPDETDLVAGEVARRITNTIDRLKSSQQAMDDTRSFLFDTVRKGRAVYNSLTSGWLSQSADTPLNQPIGPNRRLDWTQMDLGDLKAVRKAVGATINDIVLATTAGAIRSFLMEERGVTDLDIDFRVMAPVSVRAAGQENQLGNQVAMWLVRLPIEEADPIARLDAIRKETSRLKRTDQALGASTLVSASSGAPHTLVALGARLATGVQPFNMTVTNVPGPQFPLYLLESRLLEQYPVVPLWHNHGIGLALFSYDGNVAWGINADWDALPDSDRMAAALHGSLAELRDAVEPLEPPKKTPANKSPAKKNPAKKNPAKKNPAKKPAAQKTAAKKPAPSKKAQTQKAAGTAKKNGAASAGRSRTAAKNGAAPKTRATKASATKASTTKTSTGGASAPKKAPAKKDD